MPDFLGKFIYTVFILFVGALLSVLIMESRQQEPPQPQQTSPDSIPTPTATILNAETIVTQITQVNKLVTAEAFVETIVDLENDIQFITWKSGIDWIDDNIITVFDNRLGKRYIKMQGYGTIKAGVDLSKLNAAKDIEIDHTENSIEINLPPTELLGKVELDFSRSHPITKIQGAFISNDDFTIQQQGYEEVARQLNEGVCSSQVLIKAGEFAEQSIEQLVRAFNPTFTKITVNSRAGNCGDE